MEEDPSDQPEKSFKKEESRDDGGPSISELKDEVNMREAAEGRLTKLGMLLEIAESRGLDVKSAKEFYNSSRESLYRDKNALESMKISDRSNSELTAALNQEKYGLLSFPKWTYISFFMAKYGLFSLSYGMIAAVFFGYILLYSNMNKYILETVPLWAPAISGLGASAQIMVGTVDDIKATGVVQNYKRVWYTALPFLAAIFGFIAYILTDLGEVVVAGDGVSLTASNITGNLTLFGLEQPLLYNTTLTATGAANLTAQKVESFEAAVGDNMRMAVCFIVGYATNAFIDKLMKLSKNI